MLARIVRSVSVTVIAAALVGCATTSMPADDTPRDSVITAVARSWHTDICVGIDDAGAVAALARDFPGARFLCFGYGERQYLTATHHDLLTTISALFPSRAALLMTVLRAPPAEAFGADNAIDLPVTAQGRSNLQAYLDQTVERDATGAPMRLRDGPYPGSVFYAATGTYDLLHTCNTWTARGLSAAGLPVDTDVVLAGGVMSQARRLAHPR